MHTPSSLLEGTCILSMSWIELQEGIYKCIGVYKLAYWNHYACLASTQGHKTIACNNCGTCTCPRMTLTCHLYTIHLQKDYGPCMHLPIFFSFSFFPFSATTIVGPKISLDQKQFIVLKNTSSCQCDCLSFGFGLTTFVCMALLDWFINSTVSLLVLGSSKPIKKISIGPGLYMTPTPTNLYQDKRFEAQVRPC